MSYYETNKTKSLIIYAIELDPVTGNKYYATGAGLLYLFQARQAKAWTLNSILLDE